MARLHYLDGGPFHGRTLSHADKTLTVYVPRFPSPYTRIHPGAEAQIGTGRYELAESVTEPCGDKLLPVLSWRGWID